MTQRIVALLLAACGQLAFPPAHAATPESATTSAATPRGDFLAAALALAAGREADFQRRRKALDAYVLAPYLDYARLRRDLKTLSPDDARAFLAREDGHQLGRQFRREWLRELARRQDWRHFLLFDPGDDSIGIGLRCLRLRARLDTGAPQDGVRDELLALWPTGQSLPDACDPAIARARQAGWLDDAALWQRLRLAVEAGNAGLARHVAKMLPVSERGAGDRLAQAIADPEGTLGAAAAWPDQAAYREAAHWALRRRARPAIDSAIGHWQRLSSRFDFATEQRAAVLRELALYAAVDYRADAPDWFERVPEAARDQQLVDWQLRAALAAQNWRAVRDIANGLPAELADTARPRYWRARALEQLGERDAARIAFEALAGEANFHGFLAADRAGMPYSICPREARADPVRQRALHAQVDLARALELHAVGWRPEAARAWDHQFARLDDAGKEQALLLADAQGWHDRAVFALNSGDNLRHYALRFPIAERSVVEREAAANDLDPAWVYALIRAESAWQPDARSHANAWGLMQLIPATGQRMARELGLNWQGTSSLLDPVTNIRLGSRYLSQQSGQFAGSPWLASAAYNAGPAPVKRWLDARSDRPADVFIETIPYHETRDYVARVLAFSVIYDWRLYGRTRPLSSRLPDPGKPYRGVPPPAQAREVVCALPAAIASGPGDGRP